MSPFVMSCSTAYIQFTSDPLGGFRGFSVRYWGDPGNHNGADRWRAVTSQLISYGSSTGYVCQY